MYLLVDPGFFPRLKFLWNIALRSSHRMDAADRHNGPTDTSVCRIDGVRRYIQLSAAIIVSQDENAQYYTYRYITDAADAMSYWVDSGDHSTLFSNHYRKAAVSIRCIQASVFSRILSLGVSTKSWGSTSIRFITSVGIQLYNTFKWNEIIVICTILKVKT